MPADSSIITSDAAYDTIYFFQTDMDPVKSRIEWIDTAKGLAIFLVVLGHALPVSETATVIIWAFHMPLFFFLSGITAKAWTPGSTPTILRGLKSLVVPYFFFSIVSIACWATSKGSISSGEIWNNQLRQMIYGVAGPERQMAYGIPLWFFTCLFSVRLLFAILTSLVPSKPLQIIFVLLGALIAHDYVCPHFNSMVWNFDVALVALVFFVAGHATYGIKVPACLGTKTARLVTGLIALFVLFAAAFLNGRVDMNGREFGNPVWYYLGAFAGIAFIVEVSRRFACAAFLKKLGYASIVIFPIHGLFMMLPNRTVPVLTWYAYKITHSNLLAAMAVALIEIALCLPIYFVINKIAPILIGKSTRAKPAASFAHIGSPQVD
jgi:fucose 4-O-acetylase-like acetyltransferase